ncbi:MAG TPA: GNAT family N-acetyltransferase [Candidatus Paceibacterota bacterium]
MSEGEQNEMNTEITEYVAEELDRLKDLVSELQNTLKEIEPEIIAPGDKVRDSYTEDLLKNVEMQDGKIFFAKEAGQIIGFVATYVNQETDEDVEYLYVSDVAVTKDARGKGVGKLLLDRAEQYARDKNLKFIRISSQVSNDGATRLYRNSGFNDYLVTLQKKL